MARILEEERLAALEGSEEYNWYLFFNANSILFQIQ
jgi:hypothetical protein